MSDVLCQKLCLEKSMISSNDRFRKEIEAHNTNTTKQKSVTAIKNKNKRKLENCVECVKDNCMSDCYN